MLVPWWVGVGLGMVAFIGLRWVIPAMLPPMLKALAPSLQMFSWLALALFGIPGLISLVRSKAAQSAETFGNPPPGRIKAARKHRSQVRDTAGQNPEASGPAGSTEMQASSATVPLPANPPTAWTLEALHELEWKRFELLCAKYYEAVGFRSRTIRCGADGGIDVKLYRQDPDKPLAIVQCKAWNSAPVGVSLVRELLGVMAHEKVGRGVFITTSTYTKDALSFGEANPIQLLDGVAFLKKIRELPPERQEVLLKFAFEGDYRTPTCPSCGVKMLPREGKKGAFWGCRNYPKCHSKFWIGRTA